MTWWDRAFFCGLFLICVGWLLWTEPPPSAPPMGERGRSWQYLSATFEQYNERTRLLSWSMPPYQREAVAQACRNIAHAYNDAAPYAPPRFFMGTQLPRTLDLENCK